MFRDVPLFDYQGYQRVSIIIQNTSKYCDSEVTRLEVTHPSVIGQVDSYVHLLSSGLICSNTGSSASVKPGSVPTPVIQRIIWWVENRHIHGPQE
jgi:hypothetical protein